MVAAPLFDLYKLAQVDLDFCKVPTALNVRKYVTCTETGGARRQERETQRERETEIERLRERGSERERERERLIDFEEF